MADIAVLNLEIRTRQAQQNVEKLQKQLDELGRSGDQVTEKLKGVGAEIGAGLAAAARSGAAGSRRMSDLIETDLQATARLTKATAQQQTSILREQYNRGIIDAKRFYEARAQLEQNATRASIALTDYRINRERQALERLGQTGKGNSASATQSQANLIRFTSERQVLQGELGRSQQRASIGDQLDPAPLSLFDRGLRQVRSSIVALLIGAQVFSGLTDGIRELSRAGIEYNSTLELSKVGIAGLIAASGALKDQSGLPLEGIQAFTAALPLAQRQIEELRRAGLQTTATTRDLVAAYQQSIAAGTRASLTLDQVRKFTVDAVQAASSLGLPGNQLAQEVRSILEGTIDRNSRVATALGITNEDVSRAKELGQLAEFLNRKFAVFRVIGGEVAKTFSGISSNLQEAFEVVSGRVTEGLFDSLKTAGQDIFKFIFDPLTGNIRKELEPTIKDISAVFSGFGGAVSGVTKLILGTVSVYNTFNATIKATGLALTLSATRYIPLVLTGLKGLAVQAKEATASFLGLAAAQRASSGSAIAGAAGGLSKALRIGGTAGIVAGIAIDAFDIFKGSGSPLKEISSDSLAATAALKDQVAGLNTLSKSLEGVTDRNFAQRGAISSLIDVYRALPGSLQAYVAAGRDEREEVSRLIEALQKLRQERQQQLQREAPGFASRFSAELESTARLSDQLEGFKAKAREAEAEVGRLQKLTAAPPRSQNDLLSFQAYVEQLTVARSNLTRFTAESNNTQSALTRQSQVLQDVAAQFLNSATESGKTARSYLEVAESSGRLAVPLGKIPSLLEALNARGVDVSSILVQIGGNATNAAGSLLQFAQAAGRAIGATTPEGFKRIDKILDETFEKTAAKVAGTGEKRARVLEEVYKSISDRERKAAGGIFEQSQIPATLNDAIKQTRAYNKELSELNKLTSVSTAGRGGARRAESQAKSLRDALRDDLASAARDEIRLIEDDSRRKISILEFEYSEGRKLTRDYLADKKKLRTSAIQAEIEETKRLIGDLVDQRDIERDPVQQQRIQTKINSLITQQALNLREVKTITQEINQEAAKLQKGFDPGFAKRFAKGLQEATGGSGSKFFENIEKRIRLSEDSASTRTKTAQFAFQLEQERIQTAVAAGVLTEVEARRELNRVYREQIPLVKAAIEGQINVLKGQPDRNSDEIQRLRLELERLDQLLSQPTPRLAFFQGLLGQFRELRDQLKDLGTDIKSSIQGALEDGLTGGNFIKTLGSNLRRVRILMMMNA